MRQTKLGRMLAGLGSEIRKRRTELGLSQENLANAAGVHRVYISDIERGKRNITIGTFIQVADALDAPAGMLLKSFLDT